MPTSNLFLPMSKSVLIKEKIKTNKIAAIFFCFRNAIREVKTSKLLIAILVLSMFFSAIYPSNMEYYHALGRVDNNDTVLVVGVNDYVRFINTIFQAALPLLFADKVGIMQAINVGIATTISTQGLKAVLNQANIFGIEIGERPTRKGKNMPSGHTSMAASAMYFVARRYGWIHLIYLLPITILTMYSRFMLGCHTLSALVCGLALGILMAALFTSKYDKSKAS